MKNFCLYCGKPIKTAEPGGKALPFCNNHYFAIPARLRKFVTVDGQAWQAALEWLQTKYGKREGEKCS